MTANFSEGVLVGYRWNDAKDVPSAFPFGFGLTYTDFKLSNFTVTCSGGQATAGRVSLVALRRRSMSSGPLEDWSGKSVNGPDFTAEVGRESPVGWICTSLLQTAPANSFNGQHSSREPCFERLIS